ncbi:MAG: hypothetical protein KBC16_01940 [Candidatus Pacebacteria bacterium]|nr:hypothetical protein [Candidatus Paceibacterota bacterium]
MGLINTIKTRGPLWVTVHTSLWLFDKFFEYALYPYAILHLGLVLGTSVMMFLSFLICWGLIGLYDTVGNRGMRDALGFETIKDVGEATRKRFRIGSNGVVGGISRFFAFIYLTLWHDPMTTLILMRPKDSYQMKGEEWRTFLASVVLSNISWAFFVFGGIELAQVLFPEPEQLLNGNAFSALAYAWEKLAVLVIEFWHLVQEFVGNTIGG